MEKVLIKIFWWILKLYLRVRSVDLQSDLFAIDSDCVFTQIERGRFSRTIENHLLPRNH